MLGRWGRIRGARAGSRRAADAGLALLAAATTLLVVAVVLEDRPDSATLVAADEPSPAARPDPSYDDVLTPTSEPTPASATPSPGPPPSTAPVAVRAPAAPGSALQLSVSGRVTSGRTARIDIRVVDGDGAWNGGSIAFGDGSRETFPQSTRCGGGAAPSDLSRSLTHTYPGPGTYIAVVTVRSDRPCTSVPVSTASRRLRIVVPGSSVRRPDPTPTARRTTAPRPSSSPTRSPQPAPPPPPPPPDPTPDPSTQPEPEPSAEPSPSPSPDHR